MDLVSHGLWAGAAAAWLRRKGGSGPALVSAAVVLAVVPDIVSLLPVLAWAPFQPDGLATAWEFARASPETEPHVPAWVHAASHHLHCTFHSVVVAGIVTAFVRWKRPAWLLALVGWWLHIALDIPTHSSDYYPVPFLYPFTYWGVDGVAWTSPWVLALNLAGLAAAYAALYISRRRARPA